MGLSHRAEPVPDRQGAGWQTGAAPHKVIDSGREDYNNGYDDNLVRPPGNRVSHTPQHVIK